MLTIGEVAERTQTTCSALRYYESAGLIQPPQRVSGQRRYESNVLPKVAFIKLAQQAGFTISEIRTLVVGFDDSAEISSDPWQTMAQTKLKEIDALIEKAHNMKSLLEEALRCGFILSDDCLRMLFS